MRGLHTLGDSQLSLESSPGNRSNEARTGAKAFRKTRANTSLRPRNVTLVGLRRALGHVALRVRLAVGDEERANNRENPGFGTPSPQRDSAVKRMEKKLRQSAKDGMVSGNISSEQFWKISLEMRQAIVERAGWDSGGWIFKNWKELPHQLQVDIAWAWKDCMDKGILPDGTPLSKET